MKCWEISWWENFTFCQANCTMPLKVALFLRFSSCVIAAVLLSIFQFRIANAMQCYWQFQFQSFTISNYQTLPQTIGHMKQINCHSFMAIGPSSRPTFRSFCMLLQLAFHAVVPTLLKTHCKFSELNSEENKRMLIIYIFLECNRYNNSCWLKIEYILKSFAVQ